MSVRRRDMRSTELKSSSEMLCTQTDWSPHPSPNPSPNPRPNPSPHPSPNPSPNPSLDTTETSLEENSFDSGLVSRCRDVKLNDSLNSDSFKQLHRGSTIKKYNAQFHKVFKNIQEEETLRKVYSCALQRDILLQGRLYISSNWLCFHARLFGKDIKVTIAVSSIKLVKKHRTAGLLPNGLAIRTNMDEKHIFVSFLSRDSVYDVLKLVCSHLQANSKKSLSASLCTDTCDSSPLEKCLLQITIQRKLSNGSTSSLLDTECASVLRSSSSSLSGPEPDPPRPHRLSLNTTETVNENKFEPEYSEGIGSVQHGILRILFTIIVLLLLSSIYMMFRVLSLEQQLAALQSSPHPALAPRPR
ncbi:GRAM domain-containing protein 2A isoform X1 [Callorhinchus milii]|nr:GRAM domain-containing protein 2A isoform X1 [Callorhinchus milii]